MPDGKETTSSPQKQEQIQNQLEVDAHIQKIGVKVPPFWQDCPEIWFVQIEAQFAVQKITSDNAKYNTIVASIESKVLCQVSEAVLNPPATDKYNNLKRLILNRYAESAQSKMQKLLSEMSLGDQKPSQLLAEMRRLGGTTVTEEFLKTLWLQNLPQQMKAILSTNEVDLSRLAILADKILEVTQGSNIQSVAATAELSPLEKRIEQLTQAVEMLTASRSSRSSRSSESRSRSRSSHRNSSHSRSSTPINKKRHYDLCWYHYKFGCSSNKCIEPCNFKSQKN